MKKLLGLTSLLIISWSLCALAAQCAEVTLPAVEDVQQQLINAAKAGDAAHIKALLTQGALIVEPDSSGMDKLTAFEWAAIRGHIECCNVLLDELESNTPSAVKVVQTGHYDYQKLIYIKLHRNLIIPLFQRDLKSTSLAELSKCIEEIRQQMRKHPSICITLKDIADKLDDQLSLNTVLSFFSSDDRALRLALVSAGAEYATDAHTVRDNDKQDDLERLLKFAVVEKNKQLLEALIRSSNSTYSLNETLILATERNVVPMAKILLDAGASIEYQNGAPIRAAFHNRALDMAQFLFESGASLRASIAQRFNELVESHRSQQYASKLLVTLTLPEPYFKTLLRGSVRRYVPTKIEAKVAMQNIARLIYALGRHFPAYVVFEVLLFATDDQRDAQKQLVAPEWTRSLKSSLAVLYLYKCNGNKLFPLWEKTIKCLVKDPQQQALVISKLENFIRPFLGNDVIEIACLYLMEKVAEEGGPHQQKQYETRLFGRDFELYYNHLKESAQLKINGFEAP